MKYSIFKDAIMPHLGMGVAGVPMTKEGTVDKEKGYAILDECMANGINYFDIGYNYLATLCEGFFKEAIVERYPRESFYVADKIPLWDATSEKRIREIFEEQKRRSGVEHFDFYYAQQVQEENYEMFTNSKAFEFCIELKKEGISDYMGASFHCKPPLFRKLLDKYGDEMDFVQLELNYMDWYGKEAKLLYEIAREYKKPIIVMSPLRGGFLTNPYSKKIQDMFKEAGKVNGISIGKFGFGFLNSLPGIMTILSGMDSVEIVKENKRIFDGEFLNDNELDIIHKIGQEMQEEAFIRCTGCKYCIKCPQKINIPRILDLHNQYVIEARNTVYEIKNEIFNEGLMPNPCIKCHYCENRCPHKLQITNIIEKYNNDCIR